MSIPRHPHPGYAELASWVGQLPGFIGEGQVNASAALLALWSDSPRRQGLLVALVAGLTAALMAATFASLLRMRRTVPDTAPSTPAAAPGMRRGLTGAGALAEAWERDPLAMAGVAAVAGAVGPYHRTMDNIMLVPALLAALRLVLRQRRLAELPLAVLTAASLWTPQRLLDALPGSALAQSLIWLALGIRLVLLLWNGRDQAIEPPAAGAHGSGSAAVGDPAGR